MHDTEDKLSIKNMPDLTIKEIKGIFKTSKPTEKQKQKNIKDKAVMDTFTLSKKSLYKEL